MPVSLTALQPVIRNLDLWCDEGHRRWPLLSIIRTVTWSSDTEDVPLALQDEHILTKQEWVTERISTGKLHVNSRLEVGGSPDSRKRRRIRTSIRTSTAWQQAESGGGEKSKMTPGCWSSLDLHMASHKHTIKVTDPSLGKIFCLSHILYFSFTAFAFMVLIFSKSLVIPLSNPASMLYGPDNNDQNLQSTVLLVF